MIIVAIRGSNGAGKTTTARAVMRHFQSDFIGEKKSPSGIKYQDFGRFGVVGSYARVCGGADTIAYKENPVIMRELVDMGKSVITEGVLFGNVWQPIIDFLPTVPHARYVPICLSTSIDQCIINVNSRRAVEGKDPLPDPKNIITNYNKHLSSAKKMHAAGMNPYWVDSERAVEIIIKELENA